MTSRLCGMRGILACIWAGYTWADDIALGRRSGG